MRYADLKAIGIKILELVYVALYRLVTEVSEKFDAFLSTVQGFFVGSSPPKEVAQPTNRHENQKSPEYMLSHDKSANSLYLPRLLSLQSLVFTVYTNGCNITLNIPHPEYLRVSCDSHNKQRMFPYTSKTGISNKTAQCYL